MVADDTLDPGPLKTSALGAIVHAVPGTNFPDLFPSIRCQNFRIPRKAIRRAMPGRPGVTASAVESSANIGIAPKAATPASRRTLFVLGLDAIRLELFIREKKKTR